MRDLARNDLFFLLVFVLLRKDLIHPWLLARCQEVQANPNGYLDLWARGHYKSTIITFALSIQDILSSHGENPEPKWHGMEITVGLFSCTRPIAKQFLAQIKREFETNQLLLHYFPDILWENPGKDSPSWSLDSGIIVKRKSNPKEATVEAWGLVDGQPTSKHFYARIYDDAVTIENVRSPAMIDKTTQAWELSLNLGSEHGLARYIGTRYHFNDTYKVIMDRGAAIGRIHTATLDGTVTGEPVLMTRAMLAEKRANMGPYTFNCFPAETPVLMSDLSECKICDLKVGDELVGYTIGSASEKGKLVRSKVKNIETKMQEVIEATFESGRIVRCTPDHKWFTGRSGADYHKVYAPLGLNYHDLKGLISVYDPRTLINPNPLESAYLRGIYDGEGSYSSRLITIAQSPEHNPEVLARIKLSLEILGFDYGDARRAALTTQSGGQNKEGSILYIRGGRSATIRFLNIVEPTKRNRIVNGTLDSSRRLIGHGRVKRDKLISIAPLGRKKVYNIETDTGNYVAWGYYTKNSQMLQNPIADGNQGFLRKWVLFYDSPEEHSKMNRYIIVDPANEKKTSNDYTVMLVIGLGPDQNYYVIDMLRDRLSLTERATALFRLHRKYRPKAVGYEQYGMQADIAHMKDKSKRDNYNFKIVPLGGNLAKTDRVKALIPIFEQGRMYLPNHCYKTNYEKKTEDLTEIFLTHEYDTFPVCQHDDMLDCLARILHVDEDWKVIWPLVDDENEYVEEVNRGSAWSA